MGLGVFESFGALFDLIGFFWSRGGWVAFLIAGLYLLWSLFVLYNQKRFGDSIKWITLSIEVPKENEQTILAVEQMFAQLHSIHLSYSFYEKFFQGKFVLWFSFEIVSFGGQIKFLSYLPERYRDLMEAVIYAHFPDVIIKQVEDYMRNVPQYNPEKSYYDVWGTEFIVKKEDAYPIRTYKFFEHQASQVIVDPLAGILESLATVKPHEMLAVQMLFRPVDDKWKEKGRKLVKKLKGEKEEKKKPGLLSGVGEGVLKGLAGIAASTAGDAEPLNPSIQEYEPPSKMVHLAPGEKDIIAAIEASLGKIGYQTKIRLMYLAPKEKFRKEVKSTIVGAFRQFDDINLNGLKPDLKKTWTNINPKVFLPIEKPFIRFFVKVRKKRLVRFYKHRKFVFGQKSFILNIEECATIFHFPLINVKAPQVTKAETHRGEAPINLPT